MCSQVAEYVEYCLMGGPLRSVPTPPAASSNVDDLYAPVLIYIGVRFT